MVECSAVLALWKTPASYLVPETGYLDCDFFFGLQNFYTKNPGRLEANKAMAFPVVVFPFYY
jgi:hypothetical protein